MTLKFKRPYRNTFDSVIYETQCGDFEIRKIDTPYGEEYRLLQRDEESSSGWEWCQTFRLLRDAKEAAQAIND